jgi:tRNA modification GTPase
LNDNRYCLLTSGVPAAIAVIEFRGSNAAEWIRQHWTPASGRQASVIESGTSIEATKTVELKQDSIRFGLFCSSGLSAKGDSNSAAGEAVVLCRTAADCYELHCHGGMAAANIVVQSLEEVGFEKDKRRGLLSSADGSAIELDAAEDLQRAVSIETASLLMDQCRGTLSIAIRSAIELIREGNSKAAIKSMQELICWADLGTHLIKPWKIVLAGPPNAGKSSLLNAILGYQRAIVHEQAGTTRDLLAEHTSLGGWPVVIVDSAGVRETVDRIEGAGIAASFDAIGSADCLLLLVSPEHGWQPEHDSILAVFRGGRILVVETKSDLGKVGHLKVDFPRLATSVSNPQSIEDLLITVERLVVPEIPASGTAIPFRQEHVEAFRAAIACLSDGKPEESLGVLESILSGSRSLEIVD